MNRMKKCSIYLVFALISAHALSCLGGEGRLVLLSDGSVSSQNVAKITAFATQNLALAIKSDAIQLKVEKNTPLQDVAEVVEDQLNAESFATVLFSGAGSDEDSHTLFDYEKNLAVIHVAKVTEGAEGEVAYRRLERLAMRGFGFLLDQKPAIDPFSVMAPYQTLEQLDRMGRNFSPPDLVKLQRDAQSMGLSLIMDSPYNLAPKMPKE